MGSSSGLTIGAVILAAGESTRMHDLKALLPWRGGRSLLASQVLSVTEAGYASPVVVLGHMAERLDMELAPLNARSIFNPRYLEGRSSSIVVGVLEMLQERVDAFLLINVDQPRSVQTLRILRESYKKVQPLIALPTANGKPGHPPIFDASMIPELLQVEEQTQGLRQVMSNFYDQRLLVPVEDPLTLIDLNTPTDYEAALKHLERHS